MQHFQQLAHVFKMQAGGGLIQNVKSPPRLPAGEFFGEFDALRFTARKRGGTLAQMDVAQPHVQQRLQLGADLRVGLHQRQGLFNGKGEKV